MKKVIPQAYRITVEFSDCTSQQFYHHSIDMTFRTLVRMFKEKIQRSVSTNIGPVRVNENKRKLQEELENFVDSEKMRIDTDRLEKRIGERIARDVIGYKGSMKNFNKFLESDPWAKQQYLMANPYG